MLINLPWNRLFFKPSKFGSISSWITFWKFFDEHTHNKGSWRYYYKETSSLNNFPNFFDNKTFFRKSSKHLIEKVSTKHIFGTLLLKGQEWGGLLYLCAKEKNSHKKQNVWIMFHYSVLKKICYKSQKGESVSKQNYGCCFTWKWTIALPSYQKKEHSYKNFHSWNDINQRNNCQ